MFSHQDSDTNPVTNPDIEQSETNNNPFQAVEVNQSTPKMGCNSTYLKSCSGFLKIFALVRNFMIHSSWPCKYLFEAETIFFPSIVPSYCHMTVQHFDLQNILQPLMAQ